MLVIVLVAGIGIAADREDNKYFEIAKNIEIYTNLYKEINTYYVDDIDPEELMTTGIRAMLRSLDPYTTYIPEENIADFKYMTTGKYGGIGSLVRKIGDYVTITEPYEGFPAHTSGLKAGDQIMEVDGKSVKGKTTDQVTEVLKGVPGTSVNVKVKRPGSSKPVSIKLERAEIRVPNVPFQTTIEGDVGYIILTTFTQDAGKNVKNALKELKKDKNIKSVILDLRGNTGGLLKEAINVSNIFIPRGEKVVSTKGKIKDWDKTFKTLNKASDTDIPLVVLINRSSASASEIVSGVVQDYDRGVLIGQTSFGKGLVQNTRDVGYNSKIKMTTSKYYIPSGRCIQAVNYKEGKAEEIPDSIKTAFKTQNGRTVYDGHGVEPDIAIDNERYGKIIGGLTRAHLFFDFAIDYRQKHNSIPPAAKFQLTDKDFEDFRRFISTKDYSYDTETEAALKSMRKKAEEEGYLSTIEGQLKAMEEKVKNDKRNDLNKYKSQILKILERDIIAQYYYQKGKIEVGLKNDAEIKEAVKILKNQAKYKSMLKK